MGRKSIKGRLQTAKAKSSISELLNNWRANWEQDQKQALRRVELALSRDDHDALCIAVGELRAITDKRFTGLQTVLSELVGKID